MCGEESKESMKYLFSNDLSPSESWQSSPRVTPRASLDDDAILCLYDIGNEADVESNSSSIIITIDNDKFNQQSFSFPSLTTTSKLCGKQNCKFQDGRLKEKNPKMIENKKKSEKQHTEKEKNLSTNPTVYFLTVIPIVVVILLLFCFIVFIPGTKRIIKQTPKHNTTASTTASEQTSTDDMIVEQKDDSRHSIQFFPCAFLQIVKNYLIIPTLKNLSCACKNNLGRIFHQQSVKIVSLQNAESSLSSFSNVKSEMPLKFLCESISKCYGVCSNGFILYLHSDTKTDYKRQQLQWYCFRITDALIFSTRNEKNVLLLLCSKHNKSVPKLLIIDTGNNQPIKKYLLQYGFSAPVFLNPLVYNYEPEKNGVFFFSNSKKEYILQNFDNEFETKNVVTSFYPITDVSLIHLNNDKTKDIVLLPNGIIIVLDGISLHVISKHILEDQKHVSRILPIFSFGKLNFAVFKQTIQNLRRICTHSNTDQVSRSRNIAVLHDPAENKDSSDALTMCLQNQHLDSSFELWKPHLNPFQQSNKSKITLKYQEDKNRVKVMKNKSRSTAKFSAVSKKHRIIKREYNPMYDHQDGVEDDSIFVKPKRYPLPTDASGLENDGKKHTMKEEVNKTFSPKTYLGILEGYILDGIEAFMSFLGKFHHHRIKGFAHHSSYPEERLLSSVRPVLRDHLPNKNQSKDSEQVLLAGSRTNQTGLVNNTVPL